MAQGAETRDQVQERRQRVTWVIDRLHMSMAGMGCEEAQGMAQRLLREINDKGLGITARQTVDDSFKFFRDFFDTSVKDPELCAAHLAHLRSVARLSAHMAFTGASVFTLRCAASFSRNLDLQICEVLQALISSQYARVSVAMPVHESEPQRWLRETSQFKQLIPPHQTRHAWMTFVSCFSPFR